MRKWLIIIFLITTGCATSADLNRIETKLEAHENFSSIQRLALLQEIEDAADEVVRMTDKEAKVSWNGVFVRHAFFMKMLERDQDETIFKFECKPRREVNKSCVRQAIIHGYDYGFADGIDASYLSCYAAIQLGSARSAS